jgi:hypothetical protein
MPRYKIAHVHEQGNDLIIIPLESSFGYRSQNDQHAEIGEFQMRANAAGLRGTVVPVWDSAGRMAFIARRDWHPFFASIDLAWVGRNLNRELYW